VQNINVVVITGNLTRDPELRSTPSGTSVCKLRIGVNGRRKNAHNEWVDKPNFFDVTVWGAHGESCAEYLAKGRPVAVEGRLDWHEYTKDDEKRQSVQIVANSVQFLGSKPEDDGAAGATDSDDSGDRQPAGVGAGSGEKEEEIPL
jgi:single-strand DNA-binding protein